MLGVGRVPGDIHANGRQRYDVDNLPMWLANVLPHRQLYRHRGDGRGQIEIVQRQRTRLIPVLDFLRRRHRDMVVSGDNDGVTKPDLSRYSG